MDFTLFYNFYLLVHVIPAMYFVYRIVENDIKTLK